ncbi:MAG: DNA-directed RNA polymerase subunit D [Candidatus Aenigmarchaeota archaeon]|nr:DNA-directed RNA polymerase subunit D [Candidatus Aenigmarchaeota archaeon]
MKINVLENSDYKIKFTLEGAGVGFANALRRTMISGVPTMAIDWVDFQFNEGALFDEMLAHRLGLIPLKFDYTKFNMLNECECGGKGCPLCEVVFVINRKGPGAVYSGDMKSTNKEVKPLYDNIPITEIGHEKNVKLEAFAHLGFGKDHAKNQAAIAVCIGYPLIEKDSGISAKQIVDAFPKGVLKLSGTSIEIVDPFKVDEFRDVLDKFKGKAKIKASDSKFAFNVESVCGMRAQDIVLEASKRVGKKAVEFKDLASKL